MGRGKKIHIWIIMEGEDHRVGIPVNLTLMGAGPEAVVVWNMGDGTELTGTEISHVYNTSRIYQVNVSARWKVDGREVEGVTNCTVGVKNADYTISREGEGFGELRPLWIRGSGPHAPVYPGVTKPRIFVNLTIKGAVGTVGGEVIFQK